MKRGHKYVKWYVLETGMVLVTAGVSTGIKGEQSFFEIVCDFCDKFASFANVITVH